MTIILRAICSLCMLGALASMMSALAFYQPWDFYVFFGGTIGFTLIGGLAAAALNGGAPHA